MDNAPMKSQVAQAMQQLEPRMLTDLSAWVVDAACLIQQIPAPSFHEMQRAAHVQQRFTDYGLDQVSTDAKNNVYGRLPGSQSSLPALMIVAHTDTVFDADTDLTLRRTADALHGPGIGDNSLGVAGLLGVLKFLKDEGITPDRDIWFVATSCEEGLGDLQGMRAAYERLRHVVGAVINLEGLAYGHIYYAGIAVKRLKITAHTGGGHSWLHFGRASAIHALVELSARIVQIKPPTQPRTTFNIGVIEGGVSINTIAASASMWLDMRSEAMPPLNALEAQVRTFIQRAGSTDVRFEVEVVGERPAGSMPIEHPLVQMAVEALAQTGVHAILETGSTDGNISLAAGCPTVTVGVTRGGNAHRLDEYADVGPVRDGMAQLISLILTASRADTRLS